MDPVAAHLKDNLNDRPGIETLAEICALYLPSVGEDMI